MTTAPACINPNHDHLSTVDADGVERDEEVAMACQHCKRPAHYDTRTDLYEHDDTHESAVCFLMGPSGDQCVIAA